MNLIELTEYFDSILSPKSFLNDPSLNGLQIQNSDKMRKIKKVAFAVDACLETAKLALNEKADVLVCHHGLFWGKPLAITDSHYQTVKTFLNSDLALCAYHIPLDANKEVGNNYGLARRLHLVDLQEFGSWHGMKLGVKGKFENPLNIDEILSILGLNGKAENSNGDNSAKPLGVLKFGKEKIQTAGIISGGAAEEVSEAIQENLDLYITGEISHQIYHQCLENHINFIAGGHYFTETVGVKLLAEKLNKETGLQTIFIDFPTFL